MAPLRLDPNGRYIFRYSLAELPDDRETVDFEEYARRLLASLLPLVELTQSGKPIEPDGFRLRREDLAAAAPKPIFRDLPERPAQSTNPAAEDGHGTPSVVPALDAEAPTKRFRQTKDMQLLASVRSSEPRIHMIAEHLEALLKITTLEAGQEAVAVDGFRLKDLEAWRIPSFGDPSEVYEHLSRVCNIKCEFCYLHGNPSNLAIGKAQRSADLEELRTRLDYFDPGGGSTLFRSQWEINEFLVHPHTIEVLERLRGQSSEPFFFITNGGPLTPAMIDVLERLRPVFLIVSVNTVDINARMRVMKDSLRRAETAIGSFDLLRKAEIPYGASIVMWPNIGLESLERTLEHLEAYDPAYVRVNLPGYTRNTPRAAVPNMDTDSYWEEVVREVIRLRKKFSIPIFPIPHMFEELVAREPNAIHVLGTVRNSASANAGIMAGDIIKAINSVPALTRHQILSTLWMLRDRPIHLKIERDGTDLDLRILPQVNSAYPDQGDLYGKYLFPRGIVLPPSLGLSQIKDVAHAIERHGANRVLVVTSKLMQRAAVDLWQRFAPPHLKQTEMFYCLAENGYLGGNIQIMDMCTVSDFIRSIRRGIAENGRPDCVILSDSAFNDWGRDLTGEWRGAITRGVGIPVEFIKTPRFAF
jgi:sulfatase maturation enzyme AslB (radical SAM superfamily)